MKTRALFTLNLSDAFYTNTLNHPNQSSSRADLNSTALIVLVSSLCQPSLGMVFLNVLSQGNFTTTHIHTQTRTHTMILIACLVGQLNGYTAATLLSVQNCESLTASFLKPKERVNVRLQSQFNINVQEIRGEWKQTLFALHHLSRCLRIPLQMPWLQRKMIHALLISFLEVRKFNIGKTQTKTIQSNRNHTNDLPITALLWFSPTWKNYEVSMIGQVKKKKLDQDLPLIGCKALNCFCLPLLQTQL